MVKMRTYSFSLFTWYTFDRHCREQERNVSAQSAQAFLQVALGLADAC